MGVANLDHWIELAIWVASLPVGAYAFVHALVQPANAFEAADRQRKPVWLGINGVSTIVMAFFQGPTSILWIAGLVAVLVYIVDVRPRVINVQGGSRW